MNFVIVVVKENYLIMKRIFLIYCVFVFESDYVNNRKMFVLKRKCRQIVLDGMGCFFDIFFLIFFYSLNIEEENVLNKIDQNFINGMVCVDL